MKRVKYMRDGREISICYLYLKPEHTSPWRLWIDAPNLDAVEACAKKYHRWYRSMRYIIAREGVELKRGSFNELTVWS